MISKELANIILGEDYDSLSDYNNEQIMEDSNTMSIFDFANLCKEWASSYKFEIESALGYCGDKLPYARPIAYDGCEYAIIEAETEPEAIIKACEWILDKDCQCAR